MTGSADRVDARFAAVVARRPDAVALVDGTRWLTYAELAADAADVTAGLAAAGVAPGSLVGVRMPRGAGLVAALLGVLGHGCAYVPVDPTYPPARRELVEQDARLAVVVVPDAAGRPRVHPCASADAGPPHRVPDDTCYVIHTSGSTGRPKGVLVGHAHVLALLDACAGRLDTGEDDVWTLFHSASFDFSVWEMFGSLLSGGQAVVVPRALTRDLGALADLLVAEQVSVLNLVPTVFGHLVGALVDAPRPLPDLRHVVLGGEAVDLDAVARWRRLGAAPAARVSNMYGITETTVHVTHRYLTGGERAVVPGATPAGRPLDHLDVTVVDEHLTPVPPGTPGELLVAGASVAHGYLDRPELDRERFVDGPRGRAYRSGDWGLLDADGELHVLGRRDRQVQLRGFRVELGEPEAVLRAHPDVLQAVVHVVAAPDGTALLAADYATVPGAALAPGDVVRHLAAAVPRHLVPDRVVRHDRLPVTDHGKVDVQALANARACSSTMVDAAVGTRS
ncbi:amino acid adenylation domain-containing protein [Cellulomonas shaoxiangyii]|uniref:Amino acid adenylation domain-containing protein n=1 Tax=Cellulomonas shaoxiangyii TaxID=2566013 RepID=A0A4V1CN27_9CELL|nr:amino acid adenylation domain-containing protein [Cellulomonas shaoxiangyii]QCB94985.1 amino acid adenylation domain-containing protein [Cellulomonas shaoxiangyii]TGY77172.1 amino acid adenylation domain-containing protein [Cellulomonas shaoxiangyii]